MSKHKTQKEQVYEYIMTYGSISSMEGYEYLNITDTRTIVSRIRQDLKGTDRAVFKKTICPKSGKTYARWYITSGKSKHCPHCESILDSGLIDYLNPAKTIWICPSCSKRVRDNVINYETDYPDPPKELRKLYI